MELLGLLTQSTESLDIISVRLDCHLSAVLSISLHNVVARLGSVLIRGAYRTTILNIGLRSWLPFSKLVVRGRMFEG